MNSRRDWNFSYCTAGWRTQNVKKAYLDRCYNFRGTKVHPDAVEHDTSNRDMQKARRVKHEHDLSFMSKEGCFNICGPVGCRFPRSCAG